MKELDEQGKAAEKIVNEYGNALAGTSEGIAKPNSLLQHSKAEIKNAIKAYILSLIKAQKLSKEHIEVLSIGYASLELFTDDERADLINTLGREKENKELPKELFNIYNKFVSTSTAAMKERVVEITEFIKKQY